MTAGERTPKQKRFEFLGAMSAGTGAGGGGGAGAAAGGPAVSAARRRRGCKCLFGAPDREETRRLVAELHARDRRRFVARFNFDIDSETYCEPEPPGIRSATEALAALAGSELALPSTPRRPRPRPGPRTPGKLSPCSPRSPRSPRTPRTPTSRRQRLTDYWTLRKRADSSSSDKEN